MIATHSNPVERPVPAVMLRANLDDFGDGESFEQLWTREVSETLFELCCIPFFAYDLALGDLVNARPENGYVVESVAGASKNSVVRVAVVNLTEADELHLRLHNLLGRLEYYCEWFHPVYVAISVPVEGNHDALFQGIGELGASVEVERIRV